MRFKRVCRVFAYWFPLWQGGIFPFTVAPLQHPTLVSVELFSEGAEERSCLLYTSQFNSPGTRGIEEVWNRLMKEENRQEHVGRWLMTTHLNRHLEYTGVGERKRPRACVCVHFVWVFKERGGVRQDWKHAVSRSTPALFLPFKYCAVLYQTFTLDVYLIPSEPDLHSHKHGHLTSTGVVPFHIY